MRSSLYPVFAFMVACAFGCSAEKFAGTSSQPVQKKATANAIATTPAGDPSGPGQGSTAETGQAAGDGLAATISDPETAAPEGAQSQQGSGMGDGSLPSSSLGASSGAGASAAAQSPQNGAAPAAPTSPLPSAVSPSCTVSIYPWANAHLGDVGWENQTNTVSSTGRFGYEIFGADVPVGYSVHFTQYDWSGSGAAALSNSGDFLHQGPGAPYYSGDKLDYVYGFPIGPTYDTAEVSQIFCSVTDPTGKVVASNSGKLVWSLP